MHNIWLVTGCMADKSSIYKVMACFDTETDNNASKKSASAICYQLSVLNHHMTDLRIIDNDNVKDLIDITIDRHFADVCKRFDELISYGVAYGIVPVVMVHNLAFEMWILSSYINRYDSTGCSKSTVKPLTITLNKDNQPVLVFWDTLSFWGKGLEKIGDECKYPKLSGCWDYSKRRTPNTPLTELELAYAEEDVVVPWAYMGYYLRLNPEIDEHDLACKILTKTSVVRYKSTKRCGGIHVGNKTTGFMWMRTNRLEKPKTDYELELTHSATRGGFTYVARNSASKIYTAENGYHIYKYDANSMHICHALAHRAPTNYRRVEPHLVLNAFRRNASITVDEMLANYDNPFKGSKYYAKFKFYNVRIKKGTVFHKNMISTFAQSRFSSGVMIADEEIISDNEGGVAFKEELATRGWHDWASDDAIFAFGKFYGASECVLILNELSGWEFCRQFEYSSVQVVGYGYMTGHTIYATDKSVLSFNEFYKAKTVFKGLKTKYERGIPTVDSDYPSFIPEYLKQGMMAFDPDIKTDVETFYLSVKAELNALYGIEATNEAKNDIILTKDGYIVGDYKGVEGLPNNPKAWYQYGTHIVGWSRIHQILFMELLSDYVDAFICGDTDSHKIYTKLSESEIMSLLEPLHSATTAAIERCTERARKVKEWYPMYGLGFYECEGECEKFMAAWNKSYVQLSHGEIDITLAGIPCDNKFRLADGTIVNHSYNKAINVLYNDGMSFEYLATTFVGYNIYITHGITGLNQRKLPKWATFDDETLEPHAVYIYPMTKVIGDTRNKDNNVNYEYARLNNPELSKTPIIIDWIMGKEKPSVITLDMVKEV